MKTPKRITVEIRTHNAAFDDNEGAEVARMLRMAAREFTGGGPLLCGDWPLKDANGNTCGRIEITADFDG